MSLPTPAGSTGVLPIQNRTAGALVSVPAQQATCSGRTAAVQSVCPRVSEAFSSRRAVHTACFRSSPEESFNDDDFPPAGPERRSPEEYVRYELHLRCPQAIDTDVVSVVGGAQELGGWNVGKAKILVRGEDGVFRLDLLIRAGHRQSRAHLEFKFVLKRATGLILVEDGPRRRLPNSTPVGHTERIELFAAWPLAERLSARRKRSRTRTPTPVRTGSNQPGVFQAIRNAWSGFTGLGRNQTRSHSRSPSPVPGSSANLDQGPPGSHPSGPTGSSPRATGSPTFQSSPAPPGVDGTSGRRQGTPTPATGAGGHSTRSAMFRLSPSPARMLRLTPTPARASPRTASPAAQGQNGAANAPPASTDTTSRSNMRTPTAARRTGSPAVERPQAPPAMAQAPPPSQPPAQSSPTVGAPGDFASQMLAKAEKSSPKESFQLPRRVSDDFDTFYPKSPEPPELPTPAPAPAPAPRMEAPKPIAEPPKPVVEAPRPVADVPKPRMEPPKPVEVPKVRLEPPKPAPEPSKPASETPKRTQPTRNAVVPVRAPSPAPARRSWTRRASPPAAGSAAWVGDWDASSSDEGDSGEIWQPPFPQEAVSAALASMEEEAAYNADRARSPVEAVSTATAPLSSARYSPGSESDSEDVAAVAVAAAMTAAPARAEAAPAVKPGPPPSLDETVALTVIVPRYQTSPGAQLVLCGGLTELGNWKPEQGVPLVACDDGVWVATMKLPVVSLLVGVEAKLVSVRGWKPSAKAGGRSERVRMEGVTWEPGYNRKLKIETGHYSSSGRYVVTLDWASRTPLVASAEPTSTIKLHVSGKVQGLPWPEVWDERVGGTRPGRLMLVGGDPLLGAWDINKGVELVPVEGPKGGVRPGELARDPDALAPRGPFVAQLELPLGGVVEGKLVWVDEEAGARPVWEDGYNRVLLGNPSMPEVRMTWRAPEARVATPRPKRVTPAYDRLPSPATAPATPNPEPATPAAPVTSAAATPAPPQEPQTNNNNNVPAKPWTPYTDKSPSPAPFKVDLKAGQALRAARMAAFGWPYSSPQADSNGHPPQPTEAGTDSLHYALAAVGATGIPGMTGDGAVAAAAAAQAGAATLVHFVVPQLELQLGQTLRLVGSDPELGAWDPEKGLNLEMCEGGVWMAAAWLPAGAHLKAKLMLVSQSEPKVQTLPDGRVVASFTVNAPSISVNSSQLAAQAAPQQQRSPSPPGGPVYTWEEGYNRNFQVVGAHRNLVVCEWSDTRPCATSLDTVRCELTVRSKMVPPGHWLAVVGSDPALGKERPRHAIILRWQYGHKWVGHVDLPRHIANQGFHARLLVCSYDDAQANNLRVELEPGQMRFIKALDPNAVVIRAVMNWGDPEETQLYSVATQIPVPPAHLPPPAAPATTAGSNIVPGFSAQRRTVPSPAPSLPAPESAISGAPLRNAETEHHHGPHFYPGQTINIISNALGNRRNAFGSAVGRSSAGRLRLPMSSLDSGRRRFFRAYPAATAASRRAPLPCRVAARAVRGAAGGSEDVPPRASPAPADVTEVPDEPILPREARAASPAACSVAAAAIVAVSAAAGDVPLAAAAEAVIATPGALPTALVTEAGVSSIEASAAAAEGLGVVGEGSAVAPALVADVADVSLGSSGVDARLLATLRPGHVIVEGNADFDFELIGMDLMIDLEDLAGLDEL